MPILYDFSLSNVFFFREKHKWYIIYNDYRMWIRKQAEHLCFNPSTIIVIYFIILYEYSMLKNNKGHRRMVFGFTTIHVSGAYHHWCCVFDSRSRRGVQYYMITFVSDLLQFGIALFYFYFNYKISFHFMAMARTSVAIRLITSNIKSFKCSVISYSIV